MLNARQNPVTLKLINIEPNNNNFASLEYVTQKWADKEIVENINGKFSEEFPAFFLKYKTHLHFSLLILLDQQQFIFSDLQPFYDEHNKQLNFL